MREKTIARLIATIFALILLMMTGLLANLLPYKDYPPSVQAQNELTIALEETVSGLENPIYLTHAGDGSGRLFIIEQEGRIRIFQNGTLLSKPFLDIESLVIQGNERGLLGLAFHPQYKSNGRFFVNYTRAGDGATVIAEFKVTDDPNVAFPRGTTLLVIPQPFANHNGGMVEFGPDKRLYIGMGDGGSAGDPLGHGQNIESLLGKILRIDVDSGAPYTTPADNPFFGPMPGRDEIYATGFRNPFRFSFDRANGRLYVGDVGQSRREEIDIVTKGNNYGWNTMEGSLCFNPMVNCNRNNLQLPVAEYGHDIGCSVTGGYVYRGKKFPDLVGNYLYGDFCSGIIFGFKDGMARQLLRKSIQISSFGEDEEGEVYVVNYKGTISHIIVPSTKVCNLACPANITVTDTDGNGSEAVTFDLPQTNGDCGTLTYTPTTGSVFPVGTTTVMCKSSIGNGTCSFTVTVRPGCSLTCPPDITVTDQDGDGSEVVTFDLPQTSGDCSTLTYTPLPGTAFPVGATTVNCTSAIGNGRCSFQVIVKPSNDTIPPTVRVVSPNGGEKVKAGSMLTISWQSSDNAAIASHDVLLSTDNGATFPIELAKGLSGTAQSFVFAVPSNQKKVKAARIRIVATDLTGNRGQDDSDAKFLIKRKK
ncbi:MAG: PQQ-dependent sugar dehydrogenase [Acidobacteriota bacterium]